MKKFLKLTLATALCFCTTTLLAADGAWSATADGNWSDAGNWVGGQIADGADSTAYLTNAATVNVAVDSARTIGNIRIDTQKNVNGSSTLTFDTTSGTPDVYVGDDPAQEHDGLFWCSLAGNDGLNKSGPGTLCFVENQIAITGDITVAAGILKVSQNDTYPGVNEVDITGGAAYYFSAADPGYTIPLNFSINPGGPASTFNCSIFCNDSNGTYPFEGDITLNGTYPRIGSYGGGVRNFVFNGNLKGTGGVEFWAGGGHPTHEVNFELKGSNSFTGDAKVSADFGAASTLKLSSPNAMPHTKLEVNASWNYDAPATLDLNGYTNTVTKFEMNGSQKEVVLDSSANGNGLLIIDGGGENNMLVNGDFFLYGGELRHWNTYATIRAGTDTTITGGIFYCSLETMLARAAAGDCSMTVRDSGLLTTWVLRYNDWGNTTVNLITGGVIRTAWIRFLAESGAGPYSQTFNFNGGLLSDVSWPARSEGFIENSAIDYIVQAGGAKIEIDGNNGAKEIADSLQHDSALGGTADGGLTKSGAGTLVLSTNNTYTGPTVVEAGTLQVDGDISSSSSLTIQNGATLGGTGTVCAITVPAGGKIAPGNSIGTLSSGSVTFEADGEYDWEVGNPGSADLLDVSGTFTIPAGGMTVNILNAGLPNGRYTLVQTTGGIVGATNNVTMNYTGGLSGSVHPIINGNNLEADVIPEPASLLAMLILGLAFLRRK